MKEEYQIIDNFLPEKNFNKIKELFFSNYLNWYYHPYVNYAEEETPDNLRSLIRVKGNLYPNQNVKKRNGNHVDDVFDHKGAIFYINTNNGRTIINDKIKIDSVENRILYFNPLTPHDSENCTDQKIRTNININYF